MNSRCSDELKKALEKYALTNSISISTIKSDNLPLESFLSKVFVVHVTGTQPSDPDNLQKEFSAQFIVKEHQPNPKYVDAPKNVAFQNEVAAYKHLIPILSKHASRPFCFPRCIYPSESLIVLDNLTKDGFYNLDKVTGFTVSTVNRILLELANLHAASITMSHKDPQEFEEITTIVQEIVLRRDQVNSELLKGQQFSMDVAIALAEFHSIDCKPLQDLKERFLDVQLDLLQKKYLVNVISHGDLWGNNILINSQEKIALIDFQLMRCTSVAADLSYFLYVNLHPTFRKRHMKEFLRTYLDELLRCVSGFKRETLTMKWLEEDLREFSTFGFINAIWVLPVFYHPLDELKILTQKFATAQDRVKNMLPDERDRMVAHIYDFVDHST